METLRARVRRSVDVSENGCWLWRLRLDRHGYGAMHLDGRTRLAHRVAYEAFVGPIPDGLTLDHTCRVRHCVNPDHLDPCTTGENTARIPRDATCRNGHPRTDRDARDHRMPGLRPGRLDARAAGTHHQRGGRSARHQRIRRPAVREPRPTPPRRTPRQARTRRSPRRARLGTRQARTADARDHTDVIRCATVSPKRNRPSTDLCPQPTRRRAFALARAEMGALWRPTSGVDVELPRHSTESEPKARDAAAHA